MQGRDGGLLSEAGVPAIADPGAALVAAAHAAGVAVRPLIGPSSLLLALMASGLDGQRFAFVGYVATQPAERLRQLRELEQRSGRHAETILVIETPYRNQALLDAALQALSPDTQLMLASDLSLATERVVVDSVAGWREARREAPTTPCVFGLLARPAPARARPHGPSRRRRTGDVRAAAGPASPKGGARER